MKKWIARLAWMGAGVAALYALSALAGVALGGDLDPLEAPGSTMLALDELPPSWHRTLPANDGGDACHSTRFECVLGDTAVLDHETGLVWEQAPGETGAFWINAFDYCHQRVTGDRAGWRLPTAEELLTLFEGGLALPTGHPFGAIGAGEQFWTATTYAPDTTHAVYKSNGAGVAFHLAKTNANDVWCVRGGQTYDGR